MEKILYILRGIPGCGKSTLADLLVDFDDHCICEADKYFYDSLGFYNFDPSLLQAAHSWCKSQVEDLMSHWNTPRIVVSNTSTTEKEIKPYIELAEKYGYKVISLIVENRHGKGEETNIHNVPLAKIDEMEKRLRNNIKLR